MTEQPPLSQTTPRLEPDAMAPNFTLTGAHGGAVKRSDYRGRRHLAVLFLPFIDLPAREYLEGLAARYGAFCDVGSDILAIVTDPGTSAAGLKAALRVPFPLLLDPERKAAARYLPDGAPLGAFILDRYGSLRHQWTLTAPPMPPAHELLAWLTAIDNQCVI